MSICAPRMDITQELLKEWLYYEFSTGIFTWLKHRGRVTAGVIAGTLDEHGYRWIKFQGKYIQAANLAWFYMTGGWPTKEIDHKNHNHDDNRWTNLRLATFSQNSANKSSAENSCGFPGLQRRGADRFIATIHVNRKKIYLGISKSKEDAFKLYQEARKKYFGEFA